MTNQKRPACHQAGQTLVALLFFVMIGMIATSAASIVLFTNLNSEAKFQEAESARQLAELGAEKALISLIRDPNYSGETIDINGDIVQVGVSGSTTKTIESISTIGDFSRKIVITANITNNVLEVDGWQLVY